MNIKILFSAVILFIYSLNLIAQPFTYDVEFPTNRFNESVIYRINLNNGVSSPFIHDAGNIVHLESDPGQKWIFIQNRFQLEAIKCEDTTSHLIILSNAQAIFKVIYSKSLNNFYVLWISTNPGEWEKISIINAETLAKTDSLPDIFYINNNFFISPTGDKVFASILDTLTNSRYLVTYSLLNHSINMKALQSIGQTTESKLIVDGKNGKFLIGYVYPSSSNGGNENNKYIIYDPSTDYSSKPISFPYRSQGYLSLDGRYIVLEEVDIDTTKLDGLHKPGNVKIFDASTSNLISELKLPPEGNILFFDNYPDMLYYYLPETNQVNIIDLTTLKPNAGLLAKLVNSNNVNLTTGTLQYYDGGWKDAVNNNDGTFSVNTTLKTVSLRMTYEGGTQTLSNVAVGSDTAVFRTVNTSVLIKDSQGNPVDTGKVQYYAGAWRDLGTTTNGVANKELLPNTYSFRMTYAYASNDKQQNIGTDPNVIFQTVNAAVQLKNSSGALMDQGTVQYYAGAWRDFGTTTNGVTNKELLPNNYSFRMTYAYASNDKQQNIGIDPNVIFQTVNAAVQLKNSSGSLIDQGTVQYYAGAWRDFGTTINGVANKELLPNVYSFRMTYAYASNDKQQNIGTDPNVVFQTVNSAVQLKNSSGALMDQGTVQYYAGAWRDFGTTTNGVTNKELLPNNYSFRMTYAYASNDKQQNIGTDPNVIFQTVNATVQLKNSSGTLMDQGTVQYYAGAWRDLGVTTNGIANKELLPNNYSFRMTYAYSSNDKQQNIGTDLNVVFQTVNAVVQLKNSSGSLMDQGTVQCYAGAWRDFGTTTNGVANKELLPNNYSFRMTYGYVSKDIAQNIGTSNVVNFSTVLCTISVNNSQGQPINNADAKYYSGAWREIGLTSNGIIAKELLPANLTFRINYGTTQQDKTQNISTNGSVGFTLP